jgi:hypothetical protein
MDLAGLVASIRYKPGWSFKIAGPHGQSLCVFARTPDALHPDRERTTQHMFAIPDWDTDGRAPARWIFDCLLLCELHEAGEFFEANGTRPFYPHHQDEGSPYELVDRTENPWH